ncbi:ImmA/IrrE family metallo-endopeptidase [Microbacterium esteraromaticum]|uniref:ImmA/IrrE family metallo-endopeptidase n=1 Tax=Microbacterium esteraromaticum TaxID=57043 RepID=UPI00309C2BB9
MTAALQEMAEVLGVAIEYEPLAHRDGEYRHDLKLIRLREGMTLRMERSILAHELAHAVFGDAPSAYGPVNAKQERRADEWAALRLINVEAYRDAEQRWDGHVGAMAYDLGVISRLVETYRSLLLRLGDTTYLEPRMGAGQWAHREDLEGVH